LYISKYSPNLKETAEKLGQPNLQKINQFSDYELSWLLLHAKEKAGAIDLVLRHKKELTPFNISSILVVSPNVEETAEKLGQTNLQKINQFSDYDVYQLLRNATDKAGISSLVSKYRQGAK
jgi:hypothetical protein